MFNRILCLGAHVDDGEFGCGGTLARFIAEGKEVYYATFSFAEKSLIEGFAGDSTRKEILAASSVLGLNKNNLITFDYEVRNFDNSRQDILEDIVKLNKQLKPDLILTHNTQDTHQDHEVICKESFRAFKQTSSIFGYESFKNNRRFNADIYVKLLDKYIDIKLKAIQCYKSQIVKEENSVFVVKQAAIVRGASIKCKYAECFENIKFIMR